VLAGDDFGHRTTDDLDLFGFANADLEEQERVLQDACRTVGASLWSLSLHVDFRRWLATRGDERCVVDLVRDRAPPIDLQKRTIGSLALERFRVELAARLQALALSTTAR
jgi:hypothetical protein